ncbi:MAG: hypothetical protein EOP49_51170 [Sphingobacteriales bacterium]|nr:MAG: hypothetical protein EOP49_51170 [Sphingobacteriales bacterium]
MAKNRYTYHLLVVVLAIFSFLAQARAGGGLYKQDPASGASYMDAADSQSFDSRNSPLSAHLDSNPISYHFIARQSGSGAHAHARGLQALLPDIPFAVSSGNSCCPVSRRFGLQSSEWSARLIRVLLFPKHGFW